MKESLNRQSFKNYEHLIILSNNIKDNTEELVEKFKCEKTIVYYERTRTYNKFDAINQGIQKINGRYLIILHGDDYFSNNNCLKNLSEFFKTLKKEFFTAISNLLIRITKSLEFGNVKKNLKSNLQMRGVFHTQASLMIQKSQKY